MIRPVTKCVKVSVTPTINELAELQYSFKTIMGE